MRLFGLAVAVIVITAGPLFAQERGQNGGWQDAAAYVSGLGGPTQQFAFASGTMPDGSTPGVGQDVTGILTTAGALTPQPASTAFMYTVGGGVQIPVLSRWVVDAVGYRF